MIFNGDISEKEFINKIKGCKTINLKDFKEEVVSQKINEETGTSTTILNIEGHFKATMKKIDKQPKDKDSILELILQELKEIKVRVTNIEKDVVILKQDVFILKQDVTDIKKCPTIQKELASL
ncbi:MAG: hypothetical protein K2K18_00930 [Malacoplasma sp.]|nr:hypothetical protein [Malacoplasma sp.]